MEIAFVKVKLAWAKKIREIRLIRIIRDSDKEVLAL